MQIPHKRGAVKSLVDDKRSNTMAGKEERKEGHLMCPVFCTVKVPTEV